MAKPYSNDFRRKVIEAIELDGLKKSEASQLFRISRNTINLWLMLKAETGDVSPKTRVVSANTSKIGDWSRFQEFVKAHSDKTQSELAELWEGDISQPTISRALQTIRHSRKKKHMAMFNEMKPNEPSS